MLLQMLTNLRIMQSVSNGTFSAVDVSLIGCEWASTSCFPLNQNFPDKTLLNVSSSFFFQLANSSPAISITWYIWDHQIF